MKGMECALQERAVWRHGRHGQSPRGAVAAYAYSAYASMHGKNAYYAPSELPSRWRGHASILLDTSTGRSETNLQLHGFGGGWSGPNKIVRYFCKIVRE